MAETKKDALMAFDAFGEIWGAKYDKAVECLIKDRDALLAFTTSRPSTGSTWAREARSRQSATAPCASRDVQHVAAIWRWS